jgi:hypothetical protein
MIASTNPAPAVIAGALPRTTGQGAAAASMARTIAARATMNGHRASWDGPVGVPKLDSALELWTFGPGAPTSLMISGAKIATRMSTTIAPRETTATRSLRKRRQNSSSGERAATSATGSRMRSAAASGSRISSDVPTLMG